MLRDILIFGNGGTAMLTIDDYIDTAIDKQKLRSDRALSVKLGLSPTSVCHFRTKKAWPSDGTMIKLATLAELDQTEALLVLNIWRNMDSAAAPLYSRILDKLKVAAMLCIAMTFIALSVAALPGYETVDMVASATGLYILCKILACAILVSGLNNSRLASSVYV
jgi:hypothetical protein